jgi:hypothetical protein
MKLTLAALLLATPAGAATITSGQLAGISYDIVAGHFEALASRTPGGSVTTARGIPVDGSRVIMKSPLDPIPDGRFNPGGGDWADSADLARFAWNLEFDTPVTAFGFAVTDANDQPGSHWFVRSGEGIAQIAPQIERETGNIHWFTVLFDGAVQSARLIFSTRAGDGFGLTTASMTPVPLPAAFWLLLAGVGGLIGSRRIARARGRVMAELL